MIKIRGFVKRFDHFLAVDHLDLDIEQGDVFGFIGPNGAGKTTTIRFLATLLKPTAGQAHINGFSVTKQVDDVKRSIGFMPDTFGVYDGMKVWEFLDFFATAYGLPRAKRFPLRRDPTGGRPSSPFHLSFIISRVRPVRKNSRRTRWKRCSRIRWP